MQTAIGAGAAIGGGFVGAWLQIANQQRVERQQRRERDAEVLADATALLDDNDPNIIRWGAVTGGVDAARSSADVEKERLNRQEEKQAFLNRREEIRRALHRMAVAHPSQEVRSKAHHLAFVLFLFYPEPRDPDTHQACVQRLGELTDAVQRT